MDFNRGTQSQTAAPAARTTAAAPAGPRRGKSDNKWITGAAALLVVAVVILLIAVIGVVSFGNSNNESKYVDTSKLQAVFLNTGQVYFGNVKALNNKYFVLTNIYYLQTANGSTSSASSTSAANTNVSLVKLGCELHQPYDQMVINRDQVTFWENLQSSGQVATAVATFQKDNPNGQKCSDQSSSSSSTTNAVQSAGSSTTPATTPSTTTTTKP